MLVRANTRRPTIAAIALWLLAVVLFIGAAILDRPIGCDRANHDVFVAEARRVGILLLGSAFAMAAAASLIAATAFRRSSRRVRALRIWSSLVSFVLGGVTAIIGVAEVIAFSCLE